jgi:hypothetical protein
MAGLRMPMERPDCGLFRQPARRRLYAPRPGGPASQRPYHDVRHSFWYPHIKQS